MTSSTLPDRCLSFRQPWCDAILRGGKRIENRVGWTTSNFRGSFFIHAAQGMTRQEYADVVTFVKKRRIDIVERRRLHWYPPAPELLGRGGIVGVASVIGVVRPAVTLGPKGTWIPTGEGRVEIGDPKSYSMRSLTTDEARWWMGAFALVLDDVRPLPFTPCKGALGFFRVPADVRARLDDVRLHA
jgi:hypothetical protein